MINFFENKKILEFTENFGGLFYYSVPDNLPFYSLGENIYTLENHDILEIAEKSLKQNENLFLFLEKANIPDNEIL